MPDLAHALQGNDLGFLRIIANAWGIELNAPDAYTALPVLVSGICNQILMNEIVEALPDPARRALLALLDNEGRMSWALFTRRFGDVRAMGAARRDRERPDLKPASPAEMLWYRALIGKAFFNVSNEPQEYAFIPDDLLDFLEPLNSNGRLAFGRPASPGECSFALPANDRILDHACTLLAALRIGGGSSRLDDKEWGIPLPILTKLLSGAGLLESNKIPRPEATRTFLEASRADALNMLAQSWIKSTTFNELRLLPGLSFEGKWRNDPLRTRQTIIEMLSQLPQDLYWNLGTFVSAVKDIHPDYQRPAGDYDSWFIRKENSDDFLRGFSSWDEVDGALLRFLITGPLHWLGFYDLAAADSQAVPTAFRPSAWAESLWHGNPPQGLRPEKENIHLASDGHLKVSCYAPRSVRYQLARFCEWENESPDEYHYRLTPESLEMARQQGLRTAHLIGLFKKVTARPLPPTLIESLERWEKLGVQARLEHVTLLQTASPEILASLAKSRAARYLGETLNATTVIIKPGGEEPVRTALIELGYLAGTFQVKEK
ncbi:MAG: helicase-associated domain-containing protein [Anaerolineaceae bacterium]|nr:helicase-associated domain-containing protein [Anaerolineaceae bacterium]